MSDKFVEKVNRPIKKRIEQRREVASRVVYDSNDMLSKASRQAWLGGTQAAYWLFKYTLLTNQALRWGEDKLEYIDIENKNGKKNWFKAKNRRYPSLFSHVYYYMMLATLVGGAKLAHDNGLFNSGVKNERRADADKDIDKLKLDPNANNDDWAKQKDACHPYVLKGIIQSEGFVEEAYSDVGQKSGYITIGSGFMIGKVNPIGPRDSTILKEKKDFFKKALGRAFVNGTKITYYENQVLVTSWLEKRVYPVLRKTFTKPISAKLWEELCVAAYNRGEGIFKKGQAGYPITEAINSGASEEEVANLLSTLFVKGNAGLVPKYGVAAHIMLGNISDTDVLNSLANSPYGMNADSLWNGKKLRMEYADSVAVHLLAIKNANIYKNGRTYKQLPVKEYMTPAQVDKIMMGKLFGGHIIDFTEAFLVIAQQAQEKLPANVLKSQKLNEDGENLYFDGKYENAIKKYEAALKQDPNNHILYSNISIAHYRAGDYSQGLKVVQDLIASKHFKDMPVNIKGYAYYNAALCYEALGDAETNLEKKLENYKKAVDNAKISEGLQSTQYYVFNERINDKIKNPSKKLSFNTARQNLGNKSSVLLSGAIQKNIDRA